MKQITWKVLLIAVIHATVCFSAGAWGWETQLLVVQNLSVASILALYFMRMISILSVAVVGLPFYLIYSFFSIYLESYQTFPIWITGIITMSIAYILFKAGKFITLGICSIIIQTISFLFVMPNNFAYLSAKSNPSNFAIQKTVLMNQSNQPIKLVEHRGKVVLLDIWHSACGVCIRNFPKLESLQEEFKNDTSVIISSLNIPLDSLDRPVSDSITREYNFEKLYFKSLEDAQKLPVSAVPLILIIDKNGVCRYAGGLNTEWNVIIGNAKSLIKKFKHES